MFANEYDITRWQQRFNNATGYPNLGKAADNVAALAEWANNNSDGWAHWPKPGRAAQRLIALLQAADRADRSLQWSGDDRDITDAELRKALTPVKAFLTRQGVRASDVLLYV